MVHGCIALATRTMHTFKKKKGTQDWHQKLGRCWDGRDTSSHLLVLCMGLWWVSKRQSGPKCHAFVPPFLGWWVCDWRLSFLSGGPSQRDSECPLTLHSRTCLSENTADFRWEGKAWEEGSTETQPENSEARGAWGNKLHPPSPDRKL